MMQPFVTGDTYDAVAFGGEVRLVDTAVTPGMNGSLSVQYISSGGAPPGDSRTRFRGGESLTGKLTSMRSR